MNTQTRGTSAPRFGVLLAAGLLAACDQKPPASPPQPTPAPASAPAAAAGLDTVQPSEVTASGPPRMKPVRGRPAPTSPASAAADATGALDLAGILVSPPDGWIKGTPANPMRLAQYKLPGEAGAAELIAFCFGAGQGGGRQANVDRWIGQFSNPQSPDKPAESSVESFEQDGLTITLVRVKGTNTATSMRPGEQSDPIPGQALFGAILEGGDGGTVFIKVTGPEATVHAHDADLEAFARSARKAGE